MYISLLEFPFGYIQITGNSSSIIEVDFIKEKPEIVLNENEVTKMGKKQIEEYLLGKRKSFDLPIYFSGTNFQEKVWRRLIEIPYGTTISYKELALQVDSPKAFRGVGMANNKNKIPIIIPCHRVIGTNGKLVGYAGGLEIKEYFLNIEKDYKE